MSFYLLDIEQVNLFSSTYLILEPFRKISMYATRSSWVL